MQTSGWLQLLVYLGLLAVITKPMGLYLLQVLDANGRIGELIEVRDVIAKKGAGRTIPIHPDLRWRGTSEWRRPRPG